MPYQTALEVQNKWNRIKMLVKIDLDYWKKYFACWLSRAVFSHRYCYCLLITQQVENVSQKVMLSWARDTWGRILTFAHAIYMLAALTRYSYLLAYASHHVYDNFGIFTACVRKIGILDILRRQSSTQGSSTKENGNGEHVCTLPIRAHRMSKFNSIVHHLRLSDILTLLCSCYDFESVSQAWFLPCSPQLQAEIF